MTGRWWWRTAAVAAGVGVTLAGLWLVRSADPEPTSPPPPATPQPSELPRYYLQVSLARVGAVPLAGDVRKRRLQGPAEEVREAMTGVYSAGFVNPSLWRGGRFPELLRYFSPEVRGRARGDLRDLSLGPASNRLSAVQPKRARLQVRFLVDSRRRPVAALANMDFAATGLGVGGESFPIRHRARYVLRRIGSRWSIVAYDVRRRSVPEGLPGVPSRDSLFILAIGSDARPGGSVTGSRADSLHVIGVNPRTGTASILGIPRDSYVPIPGVGTRKINESLFYGGPELAVETVERLTGIGIDAYLLTGFEDFKQLVTDVGGIEVTIPYAMSDASSGAHFRPGTTRLDGVEALAFSRNRHDAPGGDFGRSLNQGRVIIAALRELREDVRRDPLTLFRWIVAGFQHVRTDLSLTEGFELVLAALSIDPSRVDNRVVSGSGGNVGGQSVVHLGGTAQAMFRDLARDGVLGGPR